MAVDQERPNKRVYNLNLNFTTILTFFFLLIMAMAAAYIWGVMSGRHLAREQHSATLETPIVEAPKLQDEKENISEILKPQELDFVHALRGDERPTIPEPPKEAAESPKSESPAVSQKSVQVEPGMEQAATPVESDSRAANNEQNQLFDYIFQVAALKDEQSSDKLREQLEGKGLRTRLERSGKLYIVLVLMRGNAARVAEFYQILKELRLGEPLPRAKKPVIQ